MSNEKRKENERISNHKNKHYFDDTQLIRNFNLTFSNGIWIDNSISFSGTISAINYNSNNSNNFSNIAEINCLNMHHNNGNNQLNNNDYTIIINGEENIPLFKKGK